jgi:hypothetical protein
MRAILHPLSPSELQASPGQHADIAAGASPLLGLPSLSKCYRKRRYRAHWLREPSSSFVPFRTARLDREVFTPLPARDRLSRKASFRGVRLPFRVSPGVPAPNLGRSGAALGVLLPYGA